MKGKKLLYGIGDGGINYGSGAPFMARVLVSSSQQSPLGWDCAQYDDALVYINVASIGTSTLQVNYEVSPDAGGNWFVLKQSAVLNAVGNTVMAVPRPIGVCFRFNVIYGGSGNQSYGISVDFGRDG